MADDVGCVPFATAHCIENTGTAPLRLAEMFRNDRHTDFPLNRWMALTLQQLLGPHLRLDTQVMGRCKRRSRRSSRLEPGRAASGPLQAARQVG